MTGGRIKRLKDYIGNETFFLTYGDGVADIDIDKLLDFHRSHGKLMTVTAVRPPARFGELELAGDSVLSFKEKPQLHEGWINGGFFVLNLVFDLIAGDDTLLEREPMEIAASLVSLCLITILVSGIVWIPNVTMNYWSHYGKKMLPGQNINAYFSCWFWLSWW